MNSRPASRVPWSVVLLIVAPLLALVTVAGWLEHLQRVDAGTAWRVLVAMLRTALLPTVAAYACSLLIGVPLLLMLRRGRAATWSALVVAALVFVGSAVAGMAALLPTPVVVVAVVSAAVVFFSAGVQLEVAGRKCVEAPSPSGAREAGR